jgi:ubiquinone/menaquinone biosynthesis C-methylase UbiE
MTTSKRGNYGIDAPEVVRRFFILGATAITFGVFLIILRHFDVLGRAAGLIGPCVSIGATFLLMACAMLWGSRVWKLRLRDKLISGIAWRGDERVLDVGCGHGLLLIACAKRLTTGIAIGVDIWQKEDQAGNSPEATTENARLEGVAERIELMDGDARDLPFENDAFDVIVSSWALHNIYDKAGRDQAIREIARVLKPGGHLAIVDIRHTSAYAQVLRVSGMANVKRHTPNFLFVIPSYRLTASKPAAAQ